VSEVPSVPDSQRPVGLAEHVSAAFADSGVLSDTMVSFEPRPSQREMADASARILTEGGVLLAEAGTGIGKTLAYLVPAILSGQRVLVSTGTKNLQDQIYYKDLPALREALGIDFRATYMKGRGNYLCLHRFAALQNDATPQPTTDQRYLDQLSEWATQTETGDRAEVEGLPDNFAAWGDIAATSENCIGTECPQYQECYITTMRQRAAESDIVIVNHHLLCADAAVRQSAYGEVIPACSFVVIDEAHQLEDVATQYFGLLISNHRLDDLNRDGHRLASTTDTDGALDESNAQELTELLSTVQNSALIFFDTLALVLSTADRARMTAETFAPIAEPGHHLIQQLGNLVEKLAKLDVSSEDIDSLGQRAAALQEQLTFILAASDTSFVYFLERRGRGVFLRASPIDVSLIVRDLLLNGMQGTILTSATLTVDGSFQYLKSRLGIEEATELRLPSEFDYARQAVLYLPRKMPSPNTPPFRDAVAQEVTALLEVTHGRAFVLFTSHTNLREVYARLKSNVSFPLLLQGTAPRTVLLREFRETPNAVLLATASFWQGVDVAGEALSCVIIDKLPFASPGDPLTAARMEKIETDGGNPFEEFQIPLAILTLQQGLGRLLRHSSDRGVLALLDPRLHSKGYGRRFLASLPPAPVTHDLTKVDHFFNGVD